MKLNKERKYAKIKKLKLDENNFENKDDV